MINAHKGPSQSQAVSVWPGINFKTFAKTAQEMNTYVCNIQQTYVCVCVLSKQQLGNYIKIPFAAEHEE